MIVVVISLNDIKAQEVDFSVGADIVSSYVWRGALGAGTSIQPAMGLEVGGFSLAAWGSVDIYGGNYKEVDFTAAYSIGDFSLAITDYWWEGESTGRYLVYNSNRTDHLFEFSLAYILPVERFPLSLSWNTMFAGADIRTEEGDRAYSTYITAAYPFSVKDISLEAALGLTPWESLYASKFSVVDISLKASKEIKITESFSLPVFGQVILNPRSEDIFFVFGVSL
jgi:hypothetical protein